MHALKHNAIHTAALRCFCSGDFVPGTSQHYQLFSYAEISTGLSFTNVQTGFKEFNFVMGSTTCFQKFSQNCVFSLFLQNRCRHRKLAGFQIIWFFEISHCQWKRGCSFTFGRFEGLRSSQSGSTIVGSALWSICCDILRKSGKQNLVIVEKKKSFSIKWAYQIECHGHLAGGCQAKSEPGKKMGFVWFFQILDHNTSTQAVWARCRRVEKIWKNVPRRNAWWLFYA